jgi:hypothetical protein
MFAVDTIVLVSWHCFSVMADVFPLNQQTNESAQWNLEHDNSGQRLQRDISVTGSKLFLVR